jgi:hypothetical protein
MDVEKQSRTSASALTKFVNYCSFREEVKQALLWSCNMLRSVPFREVRCHGYGQQNMYIAPYKSKIMNPTAASSPRLRLSSQGAMPGAPNI